MLAKLKMLLLSGSSTVARDVVHKKQGDKHLNLGEFDQAATCYRHAVSINPAFVEAHIGLGFALIEQKQYTDAEIALNCALSIDPTIADIHYMLGVLAKANSDLSGSSRHWTKAIEIKPNFEFAYRELLNL